MKNWNDDEIKTAIDLCKNNKTYAEIGEILGKTRNAVKMKLNKLNIYVNVDINYEIVTCSCCGKNFKSLKSEKRKFCSQSCAAKINDIKYPKRSPNIKKFCLNCGKHMVGLNEKNKNKRLFCGVNCRVEYNKKQKYDSIENGTINLKNKTTEGKWVKKYLIEKYGDVCMGCGWDKKHPVTHKSVVELEHIDGNYKNNKLDNVKLLCPNCHALTPTYKALNKGNGRSYRNKK